MVAGIEDDGDGLGEGDDAEAGDPVCVGTGDGDACAEGVAVDAADTMTIFVLTAAAVPPAQESGPQPPAPIV